MTSSPSALADELEDRVHDPPLATLLGEQAVDYQLGPQVQARDRAAAHPDDRDLTGPVVQERLERLVTLEGPDRDPPNDTGQLHPLARLGLADPRRPRDARAP